MQVVRDDRGLDREQPLEVRDAVRERAQRLAVLEVADVVADPRARAPGDAEGALELGAAGEQRRRRSRQRDARRDVAARAPQQSARRPPTDAHDRVVGARLDRPVVQQEAGRRCRASRSSASSSANAIGSSETLPLVITSGAPDVGEQQVVQRRVGQHHAELAGSAAPPPRPRSRRRAAARARSGARASAAAAPPPRPAPPARAAAATSGTISANGLSSRCLRARSVATARSLPATHARW